MHNQIMLNYLYNLRVEMEVNLDPEKIWDA